MYEERLLKQDISISNSGDNVVITPGSGEMPAAWENPAQYIVIDHINLVPAAGVTVQLKSGKSSGEGTPSNYGGLYTLTTSQGFVLENAMKNEHGVITLAPNQSFVISLGSGVQVSGFIRYRLLASN